MTEDRLQSIETALSHQERQIRDLSDMVILQRREIERLSSLLEHTRGKIADLEHAAGQAEGAESLSVTDQAARDKPPHY